MRFNKHYRYNYGCDKHINDFLNTEISWVCLVHSSYFEENPLNEIFKTAACTEITTMLFWRPEFALIKVSNITDAWKVSHAFVMHAWCKSCACFRRLRSLLVLKVGLHFPINMMKVFAVKKSSCERVVMTTRPTVNVIDAIGWCCVTCHCCVTCMQIYRDRCRDTQSNWTDGNAFES